ncbi:MAG TPA: class I SAM-dependent methyltransferase [Fimbriimonas sp.]|nr:class I SAM-dependent methyltransferase [Fimbriimonas sp.]
MKSRATERPDYGQDAPYVMWWLGGSGLACLLVAFLLPVLQFMVWPGVSLLVSAVFFVLGSRFGKPRLREKIMDSLKWSGDERVLDVGCGSGLLLNAAAKRVPNGIAEGVDIWRKEDLANNGRETTERNARLEGVLDRIRITEADVRNLPFENDTFDAAMSLNVLHNLSKREDRRQALREIVRVVKPGGQLLMCDFRNVSEYVSDLRQLDVEDPTKQLMGWMGYMPMHAAVARKTTHP